MTPDSLSLTGKSALITGSGRENGVGAAIAKGFARNGAAVALHYVSDGSKSRAEQLAASIAKEFGVKTTVVHGSVSDQQITKDIVSQALKGLGVEHIDILVNNAADGASQPLLEATPAHLDSSFGVNVYGPLFMTQAVVNIGKMPRGGRIINIGSVVSKMGMALAAVYAAAKAAQDSLTASWASELGFKHGITVNTLALGPIPTDTSKQYLLGPDGGETEVSKTFVGMTRAEERLGSTADIADAALLIASEKSRWITAQYISVSGGITACPAQHEPLPFVKAYSPSSVSGESIMYSHIPIAELDLPQIDHEIASSKIAIVTAALDDDGTRKKAAAKRMEELEAARKRHDRYQFVTMPRTIIDRTKAGFTERDVFNDDKRLPGSITTTTPASASATSRVASKNKPDLKTGPKPKFRFKAGKAYSGLRATMQSKLKQYRITKSTGSKTVVGSGPNKFFIKGGSK